MMNTAQVVDSPEKGTGNMCEESISECNVYVTSICDNNVYIDSGLLAPENTIVTNTVIGTSDSDTYMESYPSASPLKDLQFGIVYDENIECAKNMDNLCEVDMDIDSEVSNSSDEPDNESNESLSDEDSTVIESPPLYVLPPSDTLTTSPLTHMEHLMIVSGYATAYNLSGVAFQKLLDVINFHVPRNNLCEKKVSELKQKLGFGNDQDLEYFECCSRCGLLFKDQDNTCATPGCSGRRYKGEDETKKTCFVTCNVKKQLKEILERHGIIEKINAELKKQNTRSPDINDISSGSEFLNLKADCQHLDQAAKIITLCWNTDGVPLFKSSSVSIWPLYLTINELPAKERFLKKNILIWGVWQGVSKPMSMNGFLSPFVKDMTDLFTNGIDVNSEVWKVLTVIGTMDLPARAYVLNSTHHNGKFGCLFCKEEGISVKSGGGYCRSYTFRDEPAAMRCSRDIDDAVNEAVRTGKPCQGFLGKSVISYLPMYHLEKNTVIDYMHGILLGITKKLLSLWFEGKYFTEEFFIGHKIDDVDRLLKKIKPPYLISRRPRKLKNNYHKWKASELRSWLLHYSLPCLTGILPDLVLEHYACLVEGIYLLLQESICISDLERADVLLLTFYKNAAVIYGDQFLGLNVHNLQHYKLCVKMWGPLWAYSCFGYESCNGDILKSVHGKGNVCAQIFWSLQAQKRLEKECKFLPKKEVKTYVQKLLTGGARYLPRTLDGFKCDVVPPLLDVCNISEEIIAQLQTFYKDTINIQQIAKVYKIVRNEIIFYSKATPKVKKRNSYVALLENELEDGSDICLIEYFLVDKEKMKVFIVGTSFSTIRTVIADRVPHIQIIRQSRQVFLFRPHISYFYYK